MGASQKYEERGKLTRLNIRCNIQRNSNRLVKTKSCSGSGAWSPRAPLPELCQTFQGSPWGLPCCPGWYQAANGHVFMSWWDLGCRIAAFFFFFHWVSHLTRVRSLTIQPVREVKSWVKLHSIYETLRGRKSIAARLEPLFMVSYTKLLPLPGCAITPVVSIYALCSPKHYVVKFNPRKTNQEFFSHPGGTQTPLPPV